MPRPRLLSDRVCAFPDCSALFRPLESSHRYCSPFCWYEDRRRHAIASLSQRLWERVQRCPHGDCLYCCWPWLGTTNKLGYGILKAARQMFFAHRIAYSSVHRRAIPSGLLACHHCDNPPCCNGDHLFLGTKRDNYDDAHKKGRTVFPMPLHGMNNPAAKLPYEQVHMIRVAAESGMLQRNIAQDFAISQTTVSDIVRGRRRKQG